MSLNPKSPLRILFFIFESSPTDEEIEASEALVGKVMFRNGTVVPETGCLEDCDAVTALNQSDVPKRYAEAFPTPKVAFENRQALLKKLRAKFDDEAAPVEPVEPVKQKAAEVEVDKPPAGTAAKAPAWVPNV